MMLNEVAVASVVHCGLLLEGALERGLQVLDCDWLGTARVEALALLPGAGTRL